MESWLWNLGCGILAVESSLWNPGCGILAVESWLRGITAVESWLWNPGCVESLLWNPGCGILAGRHLAAGDLKAAWEAKKLIFYCVLQQKRARPPIPFESGAPRCHRLLFFTGF